ncbi:MAG: translation initiation factor [Bacteroidales bacterium]|nr:translation initiation factor [Bacteroidales bacterium]MBD5222453.1 translation initiation factor [Bacteroidales bacterium]
MDWKDMLGQLRENLPSGPETQDNSQPDTDTAPATKRDVLHVVIEKKGRKGKTATIVEGFTCSDDELAVVAGNLKKKLGVGGSSRGGEILIQGDFKERVTELLRAEGYRVGKKGN